MATETISSRHEHVRSVGVTAVTALSGVAAALVSAIITEGMDPEVAATDRRAQAVLLTFIAGQILLVKASGIYGEDELGPKHYLFVVFMTFALWFVTWGIMLTTGASI